MSEETQDSLPETTFFVNGKKCQVKLWDRNIIWNNEASSYEPTIIPIENIIGITPNQLKNSNQFTINYAKKKKKGLWKCKVLRFTHTDIDQALLWIATVKTYLKNFLHRPKHLLLFANPYGGRKEALKIFEKYAKPLFNLAGVDVSLVVSQRQNQICDLIIREKFGSFDAVGCIGGDGTVSELINGLIIRECQLKGVNPNDPNQDLPKPDIPVGIIPAGSTNTTAYCIYGTTDVATAVLHIILGNSVGLDVVSVHNDSAFLKVYIDVISYGYLGDIASYSEYIRWMGKTRYTYAGFKKLLANKGYKGRITIISDSTDINPVKCSEQCAECSLKGIAKSGTFYREFKGKFFMICAANVSCAGDRNPHGLAPYSHLGNGYLHLVLVYHSSMVQNAMTIKKFISSSYDINDMPTVEIYKVKEFRFRPEEPMSCWNCDGEIVHDIDIRARVHRQLLIVYGRGISKL